MHLKKVLTALFFVAPSTSLANFAHLHDTQDVHTRQGITGGLGSPASPLQPRLVPLAAAEIGIHAGIKGVKLLRKLHHHKHHRRDTDSLRAHSGPKRLVKRAAIPVSEGNASNKRAEPDGVDDKVERDVSDESAGSPLEARFGRKALARTEVAMKAGLKHGYRYVQAHRSRPVNNYHPYRRTLEDINGGGVDDPVERGSPEKPLERAFGGGFVKRSLEDEPEDDRLQARLAAAAAVRGGREGIKVGKKIFKGLHHHHHHHSDNNN